MVSRFVLSNAGEVLTSTTCALQTSCPSLPSATPVSPFSGSGRNSYGSVTVAYPSSLCSFTRKIACPEQLATHSPHPMQVFSGFTAGSDVIFSPIRMQCLAQAS